MTEKRAVELAREIVKLVRSDGWPGNAGSPLERAHLAARELLALLEGEGERIEGVASHPPTTPIGHVQREFIETDSPEKFYWEPATLILHREEEG